MKKYLLLGLLLAIGVFCFSQDPAYVPAPAIAQNITKAEYFIDTDPGVGQATTIAVTPGVNINNATVSINVNGLGNGVHRLYIRTRNNEGRWGISNIRDFLYDAAVLYSAAPTAAQHITRAEYFIDTDPGFGLGTAIAIAPGINLNNVDISVNTAGLSNGTHRLYIRSRNNEGRWGIANVKDFIVDFDFAYPATVPAPQNIVKAEYFIDADPGFGSGTAIAITPGIDLNNVNATLNTTALAIGAHRLYIRFKNNEGRWSITNVQDFIVDTGIPYPVAPAAQQNITKAEYFIDTDPGFGRGTTIPITAGVDVNNIPATINTTGLSNGSHNLFIRTRSQEGRWSISNRALFYTDLLWLSADTILFGTTPVNVPPVKQLVVTNNSASDQIINNLSITAPFSTTAAGIITIPAGASDTIELRFTPVNPIAYNDSLVLQTSAGNYRVSLSGTGIAQTASWSIDPAGGHDFGAVALNTTANFNFTVQNTGNIDITLGSTVINNSAFVPNFSAGTIIPASGTITIPVAFTPTAINQYSGQLKITSSTNGVDSVTTAVTGNGYTPGAPPVMDFVSVAPYSGAGGVNPAAGQTGLFTYKVLYTSSNNRAPQAGYPKLGIDLNGDQDFDDLGEGSFNMVKDGSSTNYSAGVVYSYTFNHTNYSNTLGYQFFAADNNGNTATATAYKSGPVVTNEQLDLRIFANDISFSKNNPAPGEAFMVTANITNSTSLPVTNVPIRFYRDTILIGTGVIPAVNAFSSSTISKELSFATDGFFPIKIWIDSSNTLGESNILNNYAIRPVIVGAPVLPGGITVTTSASIQQCPQVKVLISGNAVYFGTGSPTMVAGAEVTINTGTQTITTTTDANGNFSYLLTGVTCGGNFTYTVSITDFTFTSSLLTNTISLPCPAPNTCSAPPSMGGIITTINTSPCVNLVGSSSNVNFVLRYRERDINNMWCPFDEIIKDTLRIFRNGVLVQTIGAADNSHGPGNEVTIPASFPLSSTEPVTITGVLSYTYIEYKQIPTSIYHGERTPITQGGGGAIQPELNQPDLTIQNFSQTSFTSFSFSNVNIKCGNAGSHTVKVFDSIPGGSSVLIKTSNVSSLSGGSAITISHSNTNMSAGTHFIKMVTDADGTVAEQDETNNVFTATIVVPAPDLTVTTIKTSPTTLGIGSTTNFTATIKNTGKATDSFNVRFMVDGVALGAKKKVASLGERDSIYVSSDVYTVTSAGNTCGEIVQVIADIDHMIAESDESNNNSQIQLSSDLAAYQLSYEDGSSGKPVIVRVNTSGQFFPAIRNVGQRDASNVTVRFTLNSVRIGYDTINAVKTGELFAAHASFTHMFTTPGDYIVKVAADTANTICESNEFNNEGDFYIRVVDSKADFEVLSQYISPSSLNPNPGQSITIVGTVRNTGGKVSTANVLRFLVDDIQLGNDVPINALQPGKDTTVAATATYSSIITGVKVMKIVADPAGILTEERENNNEATRTLIVGDAPDMARSYAGAISFNPTGFTAGDSVTISYRIRNNGSQRGSAWARFLIYNAGDGLSAIDSVKFDLDAGDSMVVSRKMLFEISKGMVVTQIVNCSPMEFDLLNNNDTLAFSTVGMLKSDVTVNGDLDMEEALPEMLPGWIGGKLVLGDYDLTINGSISNFDTSHFVVTSGTGKLKFVNNDAVKTFPVGPSLYSSNFVQLNNTGTADNFAVRVLPYVLRSGTAGDTIRTANVNRTWLIEEQTPGGSNASVKFFWNSADELPAFDRTLSRAAHYFATWQLGDISAAATDSIGRFTILQDGYTSFSPFTVTSANTALPLKLLQFDVSRQGNMAAISWQTTDEVNTSKFEVEYSATGQQFATVGMVKASNSTGVHHYQFVHDGLQEGLNYYRLKMIDLDGSYTYSAVKAIRLEPGLLIQVYPNPVRQSITIRGTKPGGMLEIIGVGGQVAKRVITTGNSMLINIGNLAGGIYIIQYRNRDVLQQVRLMKE